MSNKESKSGFERDYIIPLRHGLNQVVAHKKAARAVRDIREFLARHTKADTVRLGMMLNQEMWKHGMKNPPSKVKVHVVVKDGVADAELFGHKFKEAVRAEKKEKGPETLKDKLEKKLGVDEKSIKKQSERSSLAPGGKASPEEEEKAAAKEEKAKPAPKAEAKKPAAAKPAPKKE